MRALGVLIAAAALSVSVLASDAGARQTFCQKAVGAAHGKVVAKRGGIVFYRDGTTLVACSDALRKNQDAFYLDPGQKPTLFRAARSRCIAVLVTARKRLPEIAYKDLAGPGGRGTSVSSSIIGFGNPTASVGSLAVSSNCAAAWGQSVSDGATTTRQITVAGFSKANALDGAIGVATVKTLDDTRHVNVRAVGRKARVSWTEAGKAKSKLVP